MGTGQLPASLLGPHHESVHRPLHVNLPPLAGTRGVPVGAGNCTTARDHQLKAMATGEDKGREGKGREGKAMTTGEKAMGWKGREGKAMTTGKIL